MDARTPRRWGIAALVAMSHWLFGNLYEAVVIAPNWVTDSPAQLERLNTFFVRTGPTWYFVPTAVLAPAAVWTAAALDREPTHRRHYRRAGRLAALAAALNAVVVTQFATRIVGPGYRAHLGRAASLTRWWSALNLVRMVLVGLTAVEVFRAVASTGATHAAPGRTLPGTLPRADGAAQSRSA